MHDQLLPIYLNDHLAASTGARELAARARDGSDGKLAEFLGGLKQEIEADRAALLDVMRRVGARRDPLKSLAAVAAERLGRLKLNGRLFEPSPLSRLVELEALALGLDGKKSMWVLLAELDDPRLRGVDFEELTKRAQRQRRQIERWRREVGRSSLA